MKDGTHYICDACGSTLPENRVSRARSSKQIRHFCNVRCRALYHAENSTKPIIVPDNKVSEDLNILMVTVAKKTAAMVDHQGNLINGYTEEEWEEWSDIHSRICDVAYQLGYKFTARR